MSGPELVVVSRIGYARGYSRLTTCAVEVLLTSRDGSITPRDIARRSVPAPLQMGKRWVVERTQAWMNGFGKLRSCTETASRLVDLYLFLAAAFVVTRCLIQREPCRDR